MRNMSIYDEVRERLVADYVSQADDISREECIKKWSKELNKSPQSVRAVLVNSKVYVKKPYVTKRGKKPASKEELVSLLEKFLGLQGDELESLTKANKSTILALIKEFISQQGDSRNLFKDIV